MSSGLKPIMRSSDMKPQIKQTVLNVIEDILNSIYDIENKTSQFSARLKEDLERQFINKSIQNYDPNGWSVAIGKNFSLVTEGIKGWYAHVYLKNGISVVAWRAAV